MQSMKVLSAEYVVEGRILGIIQFSMSRRNFYIGKSRIMLERESVFHKRQGNQKIMSRITIARSQDCHII